MAVDTWNRKKRATLDNVNGFDNQEVTPTKNTRKRSLKYYLQTNVRKPASLKNEWDNPGRRHKAVADAVTILSGLKKNKVKMLY
jgi:hypothetical protein